MISPRHDQVQLEPWEQRALEAMERHFHHDGRPDGHPDSNPDGQTPSGAQPAPGLLPGTVTPQPRTPLPADHPDNAGRGSFARLVRWFLGRG